jgi:Mor family transcriptional regulator
MDKRIYGLMRIDRETMTLDELAKKYPQHSRSVIYTAVRDIKNKKAEKERIIADYVNGMQVKELAEKYKQSTYAIYYKIKGICKENRKPKTIQIINDYISGTKQIELSRKYGISRQRVNQIVKGVKNGSTL